MNYHKTRSYTQHEHTQINKSTQQTIYISLELNVKDEKKEKKMNNKMSSKNILKLKLPINTLWFFLQFIQFQKSD